MKKIDFPEFVIHKEIDEDIRKRFSERKLSFFDINQNPQIKDFLSIEEIIWGFGILRNYMIDRDKENSIWLKLSEEEIINFAEKYGNYLKDIKGDIFFEGQTKQDRINAVENAIENNILDNNIAYLFEDIPEFFKEKYFLPEEIDEDIRKRFYEKELNFSDIKKNPQIKNFLPSKIIIWGFGILRNEMIGRFYGNSIWQKLSEEEIINFAEKYGNYLNDVKGNIFVEGQTEQDRVNVVENAIENNILNRLNYSIFNEEVPKFFKDKHPEMFLDENAPEELKKSFYDGGIINFQTIKEHPEWKEFLQGKDLSRAFPKVYSGLFERFDIDTLMKLETRNPETIETMARNDKADILQNWYKATGGKFLPHHVVMLNFPESEIDSFLSNSKKWSQKVIQSFV